MILPSSPRRRSFISRPSSPLRCRHSHIMPSRRLSSLRLSHRWCGRGSMFLCLRTSSYSYSSRTHPPSRGFWGSVSSRRLVDREGSCRPSSLSSNNSRVLRRHIHGAQKNSTKRRLIHNMMFLNRHYLQRPPKFRLVNVAQLRRVIQPLDYLVSYDLSDASGLFVGLHRHSCEYVARRVVT